MVLEVKDWKLVTIRDIDRQSASILTNDGLKRVATKNLNVYLRWFR